MPTSAFYTRGLALALSLAALTLAVGCADNEASAPPGVNPPPGADADTDNGPVTPPNGKNCKIPSGGQCDGTIWRFCAADDTESAVDCAQVFDDGTCRKTAIIAQCVIPLGGECLTVDVDGVNRFSTCAGTNPGCVATALGGTLICTDQIGGCDATTKGQCINDKKHLVTGCLNGQPRVLDCVAMGGLCGGQACEKLPEGAECQTETAGARKTLICGPGLSCFNADPFESLGVCTPL